MTKKRKSARRPPRRTTYESTFAHASARLAKAVDERTAALMKIDQLNREIPRLERIIQALDPEEAPSAAAALSPNRDQTYTPPEIVAATAAAKNMGMDQEEFLAKYTRPGRITTTAPPPTARPQPDGTNPDPDEFLADDGPGREILS